MSRVAKNPIVLPQGVEVALDAEKISVKGPLGAISFAKNPAVEVVKEENSLLCRAVEGIENSDALSGTVGFHLAHHQHRPVLAVPTEVVDWKTPLV